MDAKRFVETVANLTLEGEDDGDGGEFEWENDDTFTTLHEIIGWAREIKRSER